MGGVCRCPDTGYLWTSKDGMQSPGGGLRSRRPGNDLFRPGDCLFRHGGGL